MPRRSELKSIASGVLGSFVSRNNDIGGYWGLGKLFLYARQRAESQLSIILIPRELMPSIEPLATVARKYGNMLVSIMERRYLPASWLLSASIEIEFESSSVKPQIFDPHRASRPFRCRLVFIDDLGRKHECAAAGRCWPHNPHREARSARYKRPGTEAT
jgi:hypothetical protein